MSDENKPLSYAELRTMLLELLYSITSGPKASIGSIENTYEPQLSRARVDEMVKAVNSSPPIEGELNPENPTTQWAREQWHKLLVMTMHKHSLFHVIISEADIIACTKSGKGNVAVKDGEAGDGCIHLFLISNAEAEKLLEAEKAKAT